MVQISEDYQVREQIELTAQEKDLFAYIMEVVRSKCPNTTVRVAGGWVRDKVSSSFLLSFPKLISKESEDIDLALDNMTGSEFAKLLAEAHPLDENGKPKGFNVIKSNSEKSKHLETAVIHLKGYSLDLVNLRSETYSEGSRVPEMELGTPEEDAMRRDLTLNALFYNINEEKVEDFTKKGLEDLKNHIARTPLEPLQTFLDDPLRILRTIRFAVKYNLQITQEIKEAASNPDVRKALVEKVTNERRAKELNSMFSGRDPCMCILYLQEFNLIKLLFGEVPNAKITEEQVEQNIQESVQLSTIIKKTLEQLKKDNLNLFGANYEQILKNDSDFQLTLFYACLAFPYAPFQNFKKKDSLVTLIMQKSLVQPNKIIKNVDKLTANTQKLIDFVNQQPEKDILQNGLFVKEMGELFYHCLILAFAKASRDLIIQKFPQFQINQDDIQNAYQQFQLHFQFLAENKLHQTYSLKAPLNGKEICEMYKVNSGPHMKHLIQDGLDYCILHPEAQLEEVKQYMLQNKDQFLEKAQNMPRN